MAADNLLVRIFALWGIMVAFYRISGNRLQSELQPIESVAIGFKVSYNPEKHDRGSLRLPGYDYSQPGAYFVTVCAADRLCIFGEIVEGEMRPNQNGVLVTRQWSGLPTHYSNVQLDEFVLMPNHIHGIIQLEDKQTSPVGAGFQPAHACPETNLRHGLPEIIRGFKTFSARQVNELRHTPGRQVWQRNYYEHVVRGEVDLNSIRKYINENPLKWADDPENIRRVRKR